MTRKALLGATLTLLLTVISSVAMVSMADAFGPLPQLYVDPPETKAWFRQIFSVGVLVSNVADLYGFEFKLSYNTTLLNATEIIEGPFLMSGGSTYVVKADINDTAGWVWVAISLYNATEGVSGSGTLATIKFNATEIGNCTLHLYDTMLGDSEATPIEHLAYDGWVEVTKIPGDLNDDGIVNIVDIVIVAIAFGSVPGDPNWDERADLNNDDVINILDVILVAINFGKTVFE